MRIGRKKMNSDDIEASNDFVGCFGRSDEWHLDLTQYLSE
jgi:hypothetical protein